MQEKLIIRIYLDSETLAYGEQDMYFPVSAPVPYLGGIVSPGTLIKKLANLHTGAAGPNSYTFSINDVEKQIYIILKDQEYRHRLVKVERIDLDTDSVIESYNFIINDINFTQTTAVFTCEDRPLTSATEIYPKKTISLDDFSDVPDGTDSLGQYINICFGKCKNVRLYLIKADLVNNYWYYLIGYGSPPLSAATTVRRGGQVVTPSLYTFFDGSQTAPDLYPGFAYIRFNREQKDLRGSLYEITMDLDGFKLDSVFTENPARQYQEFITNAIWGQNGVVDAASLTQAIADCNTLDIKGGGVISEGKTGEYWKKEFLKACREGISTTGANGIKLDIPSYNPASIASFNLQNSVIKSFKKAKASDYVKDIVVYYWYDNKEKRYLNDNKKSIDVSFGVTKDFNLQLVSDAKTASVFAQYKQKQIEERDKKFIVEPLKDAEALVENDIIDITDPLLGLDEDLYIIEKISKTGLDYSMTVAKYSNIYVWDSETFQADPPAPPSITPPDFVEDFAITKSVVIQEDGTALSSFNGSYTIPDNNFLYAIVSVKLSSDSTWQDIAVSVDGKFKVFNLKPGFYYDLRLISFNSAGLPSDSVATLTTQLADGDTIAPAMPLGFAVNDDASRVLTSWDENTTDPDLKGYYLYRNGVQIDVGNVTAFPDHPPEYEIDYEYQLSAYDHSGNEGTKTIIKTGKKLLLNNDDIGNLTGSLVLEESADILFTNCCYLDAETGAMNIYPTGTGKDLYFGKVGDEWNDVFMFMENLAIAANDEITLAAVNDINVESSAGDILLTAFGALGFTHDTLAYFAGTPIAQQSTPDPAAIVTTETAGASYTSNEQDMLDNLKTDVTNIKSELKTVTDALQAYSLTSS
ncbi:hypothetical protein KAR91_31340 [Candidatus Pacearchaeota archaeon]|nr:hypothetical protein [Candidatus Pacearchaeota archaeon]